MDESKSWEGSRVPQDLECLNGCIVFRGTILFRTVRGARMHRGLGAAWRLRGRVTKEREEINERGSIEKCVLSFEMFVKTVGFERSWGEL